MIRHFIVVVALVALPSLAKADLLFSVDPGSVAIPLVPTTESDILTGGPAPAPPAVVTPDFALGLAPFDNLNALSFGGDKLWDFTMPFPSPTLKFQFSVDRLSIGLPLTEVEFQAAFAPGAPEASADIFTTTRGSFTNSLYRDQSAIPLTPGLFGDDLDALDLTQTLPGGMPYFSIDDLSTSNGGGGGGMANDIFVGAFGAVFADGVFDMGLDPLDDIDALMLVDRGTIGVLDPGLDGAIFSLTSFSPSTATGGGGFYVPGPIDSPLLAGGATHSGADLFWTDFRGASFVYADAMSIGLDPFMDELNALSNPEPGSLALLCCGLGGFAVYRRRKKRKK